jgi:hypothetical protein
MLSELFGALVLSRAVATADPKLSREILAASRGRLTADSKKERRR